MQECSENALATAVEVLISLVGSDGGLPNPTTAELIEQEVPRALPATTQLEPYQQHLFDGYFKSTANEILFLPTGFGANSVVDGIIHRTLTDQSDKHVVVVVVRPSQALSHAARLSQALNVDVGVFCGGDFLYDFPADFKRSKVLVFTAGLFLRILKLGTYNITQASLLVLHDAFAAVRNHPMNTLIREYYFKAPIADASQKLPRLLGVVGPQLNQMHRPFDKARQQLRKLCNSLQAGVLLPQGPSLEALVSRLHCGRLFLEAYDQSEQEQGLATVLQMHCLAIWDVLHEFNLNHFGRLIHVPQMTQPLPGMPPPDQAGTTTTTTTAAADSATAGQQQQQQQVAVGVPVGKSSHPQAHPQPIPAVSSVTGTATSSTPGSPASLPSAYPSPRSAFPSPFPSPRSFPSPRTPGTLDVPTPWLHPADPMQHDWDEIEVMIADTIKQTEALPEDGERRRSVAALEVMRHVGQCIRAERRCLELGIDACLQSLLPALRSLLEFLASPLEVCPHQVEEQALREAIERAAEGSTLLTWLTQLQQYREEAKKNEIEEPAPARMQVLLNMLTLLRTADPLPVGDVTDESVEISPGPGHIAVVIGDESSLGAVSEAIKGYVPLAEAPLVTYDESNPPATDNDDGDEDQSKELTITLMTRQQVNTPAGQAFLRLQQDLVWFSAADVMHAASHDLETPALATCRQMCSTGPPSKGPNCHIIATVNQAWAYMDICRADQSLLSAMQLVSGGDAALEDRLLQLAAGGSLRSSPSPVQEGLSSFQIKAVEQSASSVLGTICLGLCGHAPTYTTEKAGTTAKRYRTTVNLPKAMMVLNEEEDIEEEFAAADSSIQPVTLEEHYRGIESPSETEAKESAAEYAVLALLHTGILAAYWPSGPLVAQAQSNGAGAGIKAAQQYAAALAAMTAVSVSGVEAAAAAAVAEVDLPGTGASGGGDHPAPGGGGVHGEASGLVSPFAAAHLVDNLSFGRPSPRRHYSPRVLEGGKPACAICGIVATSEQHLEEHLKGRRHQRTLERLQRRLPSATLALARSSSLPAGVSSTEGLSLNKSSSSIHQGFPCIRVGDIVLPSSMDLRAFLEEMQTLGELDIPASEPLPRIEESDPASQNHGSGGSGPSGSGTSYPPHRTLSGGGGGMPRRTNSGGGASWQLPPVQLQMQMPMQQGMGLGMTHVAMTTGMGGGEGGKRAMVPSPLGPGGGGLRLDQAGGIMGAGGGPAAPRPPMGGRGAGGTTQWHPRLPTRFVQQQMAAQSGAGGTQPAAVFYHPTGYVISPRGVGTAMPVEYGHVVQQYHAVPQYAAVSQYHPVAVMPMTPVMVPFATMQGQQGGGYPAGLPPRPSSRHVSPRQSPREQQHQQQQQQQQQQQHHQQQ